jgi:1,4-dihydroxy-6-naphthoate synthase
VPDSRQLIRIAHSPDPDDAFMFYALAREKLDVGPFRFEHVLRDIQTLNEWAQRGEMELTAISFHAYPYLKDRYALMNCGASLGDRYGPMVVAREPMSIDALPGRRIAVPGKLTTAYLVLNLLLGLDAYEPVTTPFDQILGHVASGQVDAGLIIHEGQLTYGRESLHCVVDLGQWWHEQTQLPLPLGANAIRRDLGPAVIGKVSRLLGESIRYALDHRAEAVEYALGFGRGLDRQLADRFVGMYVNERTLDLGEVGRRAVAELLGRAHKNGLVPDFKPLDFVM